ncbi:5-bromo-4-chloroindolyl phosphate hydrolysis family protein [Gracilibacillus salinarum]|uniref:5-bromo-4-chloroindolyl phosphate hydrolysis family protein n=1 Tax=Gracilibacillus salinarum TaxID=2932255 RepID=A0ABY4GKQ7_9BACI|nr:5-bromo-4-chloroindolyl phosphate hydrolysis family protein [Gracilibacillus salinarum]UOQ84756.1 5-bromo-4-chloroindolyl phosphate hydrolysis family protein [Gracilibacillus salinarum]
MFKLLTVVIGIFIAVPVMITTWFVSFFAIDLSYWYASLLSLIVAGLTYGLVSVISHFRFLKNNQLTLKDYRYIRKNLAEARPKIRRLQKALFSIHHLTFIKDNMDLVRVARKIYRTTKKEPKRFYQGSQFYFSHIDSAVELTEKYALLSSQPAKNKEMELVLKETRHALKDIQAKIEQDLYDILSDDLEQLQFEVDFAKHKKGLDYHE